MATAASASPSTSSKPKLLPHQLVARDARSTYIQRVQTLAGPGAYVIPSTFQQKQATQLNDKLRDVQQSQYGREFARKQRGQQQINDARLEQPQLSTGKTTDPCVALDKYRMRRDHLRAMLQRMHHNSSHSNESWQQHELSSPVSVNATNRATTALSMSPSPSCYDAFVAGYRHQDEAHATERAVAATACAQVAPLDLRLAPVSPSNASSYSELEEIEVAIEDLSDVDAVMSAASPVQQQLPLQPPLSYAQFLSGTSYARRLQKKKKRSCSQ